MPHWHTLFSWNANGDERWCIDALFHICALEIKDRDRSRNACGVNSRSIQIFMLRRAPSLLLFDAYFSITSSSTDRKITIHDCTSSSHVSVPSLKTAAEYQFFIKLARTQVTNCKLVITSFQTSNVRTMSIVCDQYGDFKVKGPTWLLTAFFKSL